VSFNLRVSWPEQPDVRKERGRHRSRCRPLTGPASACDQRVIICHERPYTSASCACARRTCRSREWKRASNSSA